MTDALSFTFPNMRDLAEKIISSPDAVQMVQSLSSGTFSDLIAQRGLEDAGLLLAVADSDQLAAMMDDLLWRASEAGEDERFSPAHFVLLLSAFLENGDAEAAERLASVEEDMLVLGFHQCVAVIEFERLRLVLQSGSDFDLALKRLAGAGFQEIEEFVLLPRISDGFDLVVAALVSLENRHFDLLRFILERCAVLTENEYEDQDQWFDLLSEAESLEQDVSWEREERRRSAGYVTRADALKFLADAAARNVSGIQRELDKSRRRVMDRDRLFRDALITLSRSSPKAHAQCLDDIVKVCNCLMVGIAFRGEKMSKATAIVAVGAVCNLGADLSLQQSGAEGNDDYLANLLVQKGAIHFFEMGFACLHGSVRRAALKGINQLALDCIQKASSQQQAKELHALHEKIVALNASNAVVSYECPDLMDLSDWLEGAALSQLEAAIEPLPHLSSPQAGSQGSPYRSSDGIGFISNLEEIDELNAQFEDLFGKPNSASATHS